ncbi:MAG: leucine-rich repeat protein [Clostridia bacterium]|nr:leucine-rich repeat protein [Clostridia bacterium]
MDLFLKILNMSFSATWLIFAVIFVRFLLKKSPKYISEALWGLVAFRLVFPWSIKSVVSLIPSAKPIPEDIVYSPSPSVNSGFETVDSVINPIISQNLAPKTGESVNPVQILLFICSIIWFVGIAAIVIFSLVSYIRLSIKLKESVELTEGVYCCDGIDTPFIIGIIKPKIVLPSSIDAEQAKYVIAHEKAHLKRFDHLQKLLGYVLLTVHWFNPICWIAYKLFCVDIELACDEKVIKEFDTVDKKQYSKTLFDLSVSRKKVYSYPLAFGEVAVKDRIRNILNYKKPTFWVIIVSVLAAVLLAVFFITDPESQPASDEMTTLSTTQAETGRTEPTSTKPTYSMTESQVSLTVAQAMPYSGKIGTLTWSIDEKGTFRLDGEGELRDFEGPEMEITPWHHHADKVKKMIIGDGVTKIGSYTFPGLTSLKQVHFGKSVKYIGACAFCSCPIEDLKLNDGLKEIGYAAFCQASAKELVIPDSVEKLGPDAISGDFDTIKIGKGVKDFLYSSFVTPAKRFVVDPENEFLSNDSHGVLFNKDKTELIRFPVASDIEKYEIPNTVKYIFGDNGYDFYGAFSNCAGNYNLKSVVIPESVESIGGAAFGESRGLTDIKIGSNIKHLGGYVFGHTGYWLDESNWENGVLYLDNYLIDSKEEKCSSRLEIKNGTTLIGGGAFANNRSIENLIIPDSVKIICENAFSMCEILKTVDLGAGVEIIEDHAFFLCENLISIDIPDSAKYLGKNSFTGCRGMKSLSIGKGVTEIPQECFSFCENLKTLTFTSNVRIIGDSAFNDNKELNTVYYYGTKEQWESIEVSEDNTHLKNANIVYLDGTPD